MNNVIKIPSPAFIAGLVDSYRMGDRTGQHINTQDAIELIAEDFGISVSMVRICIRAAGLHMTQVNSLADVPAAACGHCGGWSSSGGMSQHHQATSPVHGRTGCSCNK